MNQLVKHRCETCNVGFADADRAFAHAQKYGHGITVQAEHLAGDLLDAEIKAHELAARTQPNHGKRQPISIMVAAGLETAAPALVFVPNSTDSDAVSRLSGPERVADGFQFTVGADDETKTAFAKLYAERKAERAAKNAGDLTLHTFVAGSARPTPTAERELSAAIARRVADSGMPTGTMGIVYSLTQAAVAWALADARADRCADALNDATRAHGVDPTQASSGRCDAATDALTKASYEEQQRDAAWRRIAKALVVELDR